MEKKSRGAYMTKYDKENYRRYHFKLSLKNEKDLIKHLDKQDNMQAYIKELIKKDMK